MITTKVVNRKEKGEEEKKMRRIDRCPWDVVYRSFFYHFDRQTDIDKSLVDIRKRLELL